MIGWVGVSYGMNLTQTVDPEMLLFQSILLILLIKVIAVILVLYFKDFLVLLFNSFIGACLFVISFGQLTNNMLSLEEIIERRKYDKDY